jgi:hypothetical protein
VLIVAAIKLGNPVIFRVLMKIDDAAFHGRLTHFAISVWRPILVAELPFAVLQFGLNVVIRI